MYGILNKKGLLSHSGNDDELLAAFVAPISVISNQPISSSDTLSLKRITATPAGQRWEIETGLMPSNDTAELLVHSVEHGKHTPFYVRFPQVYLMNKVYSSNTNLAIDGNHTTADGSVVKLNKQIGNRISIGEFIQFGQIYTSNATSKVYLVTGINGYIVTITPRLQRDHVGGTPVIGGNNVSSLMYYDSDTIIGMKYIDGVLMDMGTVKLVEAL
jgi:hypothetical protein